MFVEIQTHDSINRTGPQVGEDVFVADSARVIGDVVLGKGVSVWYNVVIRGDVMPIVVGEHTNIQDGSVIHATHKKNSVVLGDKVTIGHMCVLHGCKVNDLCLIGMGSLLMDDVEIPEKCIVAAGSLVTSQQSFRSKTLILGRPAKELRKLTEEELEFLEQSAKNYLNYKKWYKR